MNSSSEDLYAKTFSLGNDINKKNSKGNAAIHMAITRGEIEHVQSMIEEYSADLEIRDANSNTPLLLAFHCQNYELVQLLLTYGADFRAMDLNNNTPLHLAFHQNFLEIARELVSMGASINAVNYNGNSPLMLACHCKSFELASMLLQNGAGK
jgi:ankyrin repeat protein